MQEICQFLLLVTYWQTCDSTADEVSYKLTQHGISITYSTVYRLWECKFQGQIYSTCSLEQLTNSAITPRSCPKGRFAGETSKSPWHWGVTRGLYSQAKSRSGVSFLQGVCQSHLSREIGVPRARISFRADLWNEWLSSLDNVNMTVFLKILNSCFHVSF